MTHECGSDDSVRHWFLNRGPHGAQFRWHRERHIHASDLSLLRKFIGEISMTDPVFPAKARRVAIEALESPMPNVIRRGIQVLAIVGTADDLALMRKLTEHSNEDVAKDARSCLFVWGAKPNP